MYKIGDKVEDLVCGYNGTIIDVNYKGEWVYTIKVDGIYKVIYRPTRELREV